MKSYNCFLFHTERYINLGQHWKKRHIYIGQSGYPCILIQKQQPIFLHNRLWISPWIKSISNELDITFHVITAQLSGHCDIIIMTMNVSNTELWSFFVSWTNNQGAVIWDAMRMWYHCNEESFTHPPLHITFKSHLQYLSFTWTIKSHLKCIKKSLTIVEYLQAENEMIYNLIKKVTESYSYETCSSYHKQQNI